MTPQEAATLVPILQAYAGGQVVQYRSKVDGGPWDDYRYNVDPDLSIILLHPRLEWIVRDGWGVSSVRFNRPSGPPRGTRGTLIQIGCHSFGPMFTGVLCTKWRRGADLLYFLLREK